MGWIGVDLDGTLAQYSGWQGPGHIGDPVPLMLMRVKDWLEHGLDVRIFTARVAPESLRCNNQTLSQVRETIWAWCDKHVGRRLPITHEKDLAMIALWDDRATEVVANTGVALLDRYVILAEALQAIQGVNDEGIGTITFNTDRDIVGWMREQAQKALENVEVVPEQLQGPCIPSHEEALMQLRQARAHDFKDAAAYEAWVVGLAIKALRGD